MASKFPWDQVKAESLRSICLDLGFRSSTKAQNLEFLKLVEDTGLDVALATQKSNSTRTAKHKGAEFDSEPPEVETPEILEPERRSKRSRKSTTKAQANPTTPVKARPQPQPKVSPDKFDGIELPNVIPSRRGKPSMTCSSPPTSAENAADSEMAQDQPRAASETVPETTFTASEAPDAEMQSDIDAEGEADTTS